MDLNGDGILDMISGSYEGEILMYEGLKDGGFDSPVELKQADDIKNKTQMDNYLNNIFSAVTFGDFNGDGLLDAFVGGYKGIRVMINEGSKTEPLFGKRTPLLLTDGAQVSVYEKQEIGQKAKDFKSFVTFIDWDKDGVGDLITTSSYFYSNQLPILFFKGVKTADGLRFEDGIPLIKQEPDTKALPGVTLIPYFGDYNEDGRMDILLGVSMFCDIEKDSLSSDIQYTPIINNKPDKNIDLSGTKAKGYVILFPGIK